MIIIAAKKGKVKNFLKINSIIIITLILNDEKRVRAPLGGEPDPCPRTEHGENMEIPPRNNLQMLDKAMGRLV